MHSVAERYVFTGDDLGPAYSAAVDAIEAGELVVLPTDTVYGIAADAFKPEAVQRLLDAKGRGREMPPPVLISSAETLEALASSIPDAGRTLCEEFWPGPLTVICHAQSSLLWDLGETRGTVALRVPAHEDTAELLSRTGPLAVSSANLSGQPAALEVYDAEEQLGDSVSVYLDGGPSEGGEPSTIVDLTADVPRVVRVGAISVEQLRKVVPEITDPADEVEIPAEVTASEEASVLTHGGSDASAGEGPSTSGEGAASDDVADKSADSPDASAAEEAPASGEDAASEEGSVPAHGGSDAVKRDEQG